MAGTSKIKNPGKSCQMKLATHIHEQAAAKAFSKQAPLFDALYRADPIIQYKRERVRDHLLQSLQEGSSILELNAGTGEDAIWLATQGHRVHATDISPAMQEIFAQKTSGLQQAGLITQEICSFSGLEKLQNKGPYDHVFSNFAGLNCTRDLRKVLDSFSSLLRPGGRVTLVILPRFCLWEFLLVFKGKFKTAFRRLGGSIGAKAHIEGEYFRCWYYNPAFVRKHLKGDFESLKTEGLCTLVPPSYLEGFEKKHPKLFQYLKRKEA